MRFKLSVFPLLIVCLAYAAIPAFSQVVPQYQRGGLNLTIGAGPSSWDVDWGHGRMLGGAVWADWYPGRMPSFLRGLGVEAEGRDISKDPNLNAGQYNQRQDTAGGGPVYAWRISERFHPIMKTLVEEGSIDFYPLPHYSHDTRMLIAPGGGFELRFWGPLWWRGDYEYQYWVGPLLGKTLNPQGFTSGISYDFSHSYQKH